MFRDYGIISHPLNFSCVKAPWVIVPSAISDLTRGSASVKAAWRLSTVSQTWWRPDSSHGRVMLE